MADRVANEELQEHFKSLVEKFPVPEEKEVHAHQPPEPTEPHPEDEPSLPAGGVSSSENRAPEVFDIGVVERPPVAAVSRGNKRVAVDKNCASATHSKRLKNGNNDKK